MVYAARACRAALLKKGFASERHTTDEFFYFHYQGRKTSVWTKLSHGRGEDLRDKILGQIRRQLHLETGAQLADFIDCPMTAEQYARFLVERGFVATDQGAN